MGKSDAFYFWADKVKKGDVFPVILFPIHQLNRGLQGSRAGCGHKVEEAWVPEPRPETSLPTKGVHVGL